MNELKPTNAPHRTGIRPVLARAIQWGAAGGLAAGLLALGAVFGVAQRCLPFQISQPPQPWPWVCSGRFFGAIGYLAFPVNLLTNELGRAALLAPLALILYSLVGALVGLVIGLIRTSAMGIRNMRYQRHQKYQRHQRRQREQKDKRSQRG